MLVYLLMKHTMLKKNQEVALEMKFKKTGCIGVHDSKYVQFGKIEWELEVRERKKNMSLNSNRQPTVRSSYSWNPF